MKNNHYHFLQSGTEPTQQQALKLENQKRRLKQKYDDAVEMVPREVRHERAKFITQKDKDTVMKNVGLLVKQIGYQSMIKIEREKKKKFSEKFILPQLINNDAKKDYRYMQML